MDERDRRIGEAEALATGRAFTVTSHLQVVEVRGDDAPTWLHDLLTADIVSLVPGTACRSLLLTPTGRIRADLTVGRVQAGFALLQERDIGDDIAAALRPYVLSARVELRPSTHVVITTCAEPATRSSSVDVAPSHLGVGRDLLPDDLAEAGAALTAEGAVKVDLERLDDLRVRLGCPRIGVDFEPGALPAEAGLDSTIDVDKGCFLGQESVAKVRRLGHPPSVVRHVRADHELVAGDQVRAEDVQVGRVTSAAPSPAGWFALVRVPWAAAASQLRASDGRVLLDVPTRG